MCGINYITGKILKSHENLLKILESNKNGPEKSWDESSTNWQGQENDKI